MIASDDTGDLVSGLKKARVPTLVLPAAADLEETYSQFERVGQATGHEEEATELVDETRSGIEQAVEEAPDAEGVSYFHELSPDLYTATSDTFIGAGLRAVRARERRRRGQGGRRLPPALHASTSWAPTRTWCSSPTACAAA